MPNSTERAVLAGGCFWGMQDLIRRYPGRHLDPGRLYRRRRPQRHLPQPRQSRRGDRDHLRPGEDQLPQAPGVLLPDPRPVDPQPPGQRHGRELPLGDLLSPTTSRSASRSTPSPTSTPRACGPARRRRRSSRPVRSGRPSPSIRIISSAIRTATPATSSAPTGCCRSARPRSSGAPEGARISLEPRGPGLRAPARRFVDNRLPTKDTREHEGGDGRFCGPSPSGSSSETIMGACAADHARNSASATPEIRAHSAMSSSWTLPSRAIGFGARSCW